MGEAGLAGSGATVPRVRPARRRSPGRSARGARSRLRLVYFGLAALWGFLTGSGAILLALSAAGRPVHLGPWVGAGLVAASGVALLGGFVAAVAYREASRRQR
jgi:hypothetical protein